MTGALPASLKTPLRREALLAGGLAAGVTALLLWLGPPGNDLAAHLYQRAVFLEHGFVLWNNFWYAGRYSFVTYSVLYYPLSAVLGVKVLALASITAAAIGFTVVVGREWGLTARWSSRTFAVVWAGTVLSAAFPFALGAALALLALWALQQGFRGRFALLVILTLAASPLAFALLVVVLAGVVLTRRARPRRIAVPVAVVAAAGVVELVVLRLFPDGGRYPFSAWGLVPAAAFCALGALVGWRRGRPLVGIYLAYLAACLLAYAIPSTLGSNIERLRYAAIPLAVLSVSTAGWRPLKLALPLLIVATTWNVTPLIANFRNAAGDPASSVTYWQPALRYLDRRLTPSYRVEAVDTLEHWPALFLPEAGVSIVRGWYRQNDFPTNEVLYGRFGPDAYRRWLTALGVRFVVLSDAPPDYSSRPEAALVRGGIAGLHPVFRARHLTIYELERAKPIITGPAKASVIQMLSARLVLRVGAPGSYRLAVRFSPYWQTLEGCVAPSRDGMIRLTAFEAGRIDLEFDVSVHRGLQVLTGSGPSRVCNG